MAVFVFGMREPDAERAAKAQCACFVPASPSAGQAQMGSTLAATLQNPRAEADELNARLCYEPSAPIAVVTAALRRSQLA